MSSPSSPFTNRFPPPKPHTSPWEQVSLYMASLARYTVIIPIHAWKERMQLHTCSTQFRVDCVEEERVSQLPLRDQNVFSYCIFADLDVGSRRGWSIPIKCPSACGTGWQSAKMCRYRSLRYQHFPVVAFREGRIAGKLV